MFIGYPRSGHSLVGSILDTHPNMWIAHELNVLKYIKKKESRSKIWARIIARGKWFKSRNYIWSRYSYKIPGLWQGQFTTLKVIGDKRGGASTRWLRKNPSLMNELQTTMGVPVKVIHIVRNPFDNIATRARGGNERQREVDEGRLIRTIKRHFLDIETVHQVKKSGRCEMLEIRNEDFVAAPGENLQMICEFIGVEVTAGYLDKASAIVKKSKTPGRFKVRWSEKAINEVKNRMKFYPFLQGYSFDD